MLAWTSPQLCLWPDWSVPWASCCLLGGAAHTGNFQNGCIYNDIRWHFHCTQMDFNQLGLLKLMGWTRPYFRISVWFFFIQVIFFHSTSTIYVYMYKIQINPYLTQVAMQQNRKNTKSVMFQWQFTSTAICFLDHPHDSKLGQFISRLLNVHYG